MADSINPQLVFAAADLIPFILNVPGPVSYNGRRYTIADTQNPTGGPIQAISMFMSADDGLTWTRQDQANELTFTGDQQACGFFYPKTLGNTIYLAFAPDPTASGTGTLNLQTFSMDTNTWGTAIGGGPSIDEGDQIFLFLRSDGSSVVLYGHQQTGSGQTMHWITYDAGWGSPQNVAIVNGTRNSYASALMDTNDWVRFIVWENGGGNNMLYGAISPLNAATTGLDTGGGNGANVFEVGAWGDFDPATNTAYFPISTYDSNGSGSTPEGDVIKCIGAAPASPAFALETVNITEFIDPADIGLSTRVSLSPDGTTLRFFWLTYSLTNIPGNNVYYADQTGGTISWSTATLLWNYITNPPNPPPPIDGVEQLFNISWSADGEIGVILAGWVTENAQNFCDILYYLSAPTTTNLPSIACPVSGGTGTVGVPYSAQIVVTGGTPPYTFMLL